MSQVNVARRRLEMKTMPITGAQFDALVEDGVDLSLYFDGDAIPIEGSEEEVIALCAAIAEAVRLEHENALAPRDVAGQ
jgi:hypothetical protein